MQRRRYLALVGAVTGLAGCGGGDGDGGESERSPSGATAGTGRTTAGAATTSTTGTDRASTTPADAGTPERATVDLEATELVVVETAAGAAYHARLDVANTSGTDHGRLEVLVRYKDASDRVLGSRTANTVTVPASETWRTYVPYTGSGTVDRVAAEIVERSPDPRIDPPEAVTARDLRFTPASERRSGGSRVAGDAVNEGERVDYLEARVAFYDADGYFRSVGLDSVAELPAGETWRFSATSHATSPSPAAGIVDFELTFDTNAL